MHCLTSRARPCTRQALCCRWHHLVPQQFKFLHLAAWSVQQAGADVIAGHAALSEMLLTPDQLLLCTGLLPQVSKCCWLHDSSGLD